MVRLNPAGDLMRRVDTRLENVDGLLGRVDTTLAVGESIHEVLLTAGAKRVLISAPAKGHDATIVLGVLQSLLTALREQMELLQHVPAMAAELHEVAAMVKTIADRG